MKDLNKAVHQALEALRRLVMLSAHKDVSLL